MRSVSCILWCAFLTGCGSPTLETPINLEQPFFSYPEASVYRLLSAPKELNGIRIRTYGYVEFYFDGSVAFLFPSRSDARERLPLNFVELNFSDALKASDWFRRFSREKGMFKGWIVGVFRIPSSGANKQRLILEDVTEFDVKSDR